MKFQAPYNFLRSLQVANRFWRAPASAQDCLCIGLRLQDQPLLLTICPHKDRPGELAVSSSIPAPAAELEALVRWVLFDEFDLGPFYRLVEPHPALGPIVREMWGIKPMRPASLFEMAVTVITEQQISQAVATRIRLRLVERFGDPVGGARIFPEPAVLAQASLEQILQCGYSHRKAEYIQELATRVINGSLDLEELKTLPEVEVSRRLLALRGWGPWSAAYFLIRGLARPDAVPADDIAVRSVVGKYLGPGPRVSPAEVERLLEPFRPFRGIVSFYLLAYEWR